MTRAGVGILVLSVMGCAGVDETVDSPEGKAGVFSRGRVVGDDVIPYAAPRVRFPEVVGAQALVDLNTAVDVV